MNLLALEGEKFKSISSDAEGKQWKSDKQTGTGCFQSNWMLCLVYRALAATGETQGWRGPEPRCALAGRVGEEGTDGDLRM